MANGDMTVQVGDKEYQFNPDRVRNDEAMLIERTCSCTFAQWADQVLAGSITAVTALVWILQRRDTPSLKFTDVHFDLGDIDIVEDSEEPPATQGEQVDVDNANPTSGETPITEGETNT